MNYWAHHSSTYGIDSCDRVLSGTQRVSGFSKHAFREVPFGFCRGTVPGATLVDAPRIPKNESKEACFGTSPEVTFISQGSCCEVPPSVCRGAVPGTAPFPRNSFKNVLGTRLEGTFECKARLENTEDYKNHAS